MIYNLDNVNYNVEVVRKSNKNTYIRIKEDSIIQVTTGHFVTKNDIKRLLDNNIDFLRKTLRKVEQLKEKTDGFFFLGKKYDIVIVPTLKEIEVVDNKIYVPNTKTIDLFIKKETLKIIEKRLKFNYDLFDENIPFPKLRLRSMKTRWGVCNRKNLTVTINSNLIKESIDKIDYVIIHELSHLVHFNHSRLFWNVVEKYCPNYKKIRKQLRE